MSRNPKPERGRTRAGEPAQDFEPQVTDPETRERIREKGEADALDESGGPSPEAVGTDENARAAQQPVRGHPAEQA